MQAVPPASSSDSAADYLAAMQSRMILQCRLRPPSHSCSCHTGRTGMVEMRERGGGGGGTHDTSPRGLGGQGMNVRYHKQSHVSVLLYPWILQKHASPRLLCQHVNSPESGPSRSSSRKDSDFWPTTTRLATVESCVDPFDFFSWIVLY